MIQVVDTDDDVWAVTGDMKLRNRVTRFRDASIVKDGMAIVYDPSEWSSIDPSMDNVWASALTDARFHSADAEVEDYDPRAGPAALVDLPWTLADTDATLMTFLTRVDSGNDNIPVQFKYEHTRAYADVPGVSIDVSFSVGGIDFVLDNASTAWDSIITAEPGEYEKE